MEAIKIEVKKKEDKNTEKSKDLTSNKKEKDKDKESIKTDDVKKENSENISEYPKNNE